MMRAGAATIPRDFKTARWFKTWMIEAGFTDVVEHKLWVPVNGWPLDERDQLLGKWLSLDIQKCVEGTKKLVLAGGFPEDQVDQFLADVRHSALDPKLRCYLPCESCLAVPA